MKELIQIQSRLKAPKKNKNTFGGYNYRSCEDILEAVKPICHELNCLINICDEIVEVGGRIYVKATATIYNADGQCFSATAYAREEETKKGMDAAQITGSASSYARKYALNGLLAIDDTKDADTNEYQIKTSQRKAVTAIELDNEKTCNALLAWAYAAKNANYDKPFVASEYLAQHYEVTQQIRNRFDALFNSYLSAISNKK